MDYADAVVDFFVDRRQKGTSLSSADEHVILDWERKGIPVSVVFSGIDQAFERKAEPPKSISECKRWVTMGFKKWRGGAHLDALERTPESKRPLVADSPAPQAPVAPDPLGLSPGTRVLLDETVARLTAWQAAEEPSLAAAADELLGDIAGLGKKVTDGVLSVVDEALAEAALERLSRGKRALVLSKAERPLDARRMSSVAWARARASAVIEILEKG